jgi:hypothetical protein
MDEWKGMIKRNVRNRGEAWISEISLPAKNNGEKIKAKKIIVARHSHIPTTTNSSSTTRSSQKHPTITRVMHEGIELVLI